MILGFFGVRWFSDPGYFTDSHTVGGEMHCGAYFGEGLHGLPISKRVYITVTEQGV